MSDTVEVKTKVSFRAWEVPTEATVDLPAGERQDGFKPLPTIPLVELDDDVVDALAQRWLANLYANRQRAAPFTYNKPARVA